MKIVATTASHEPSWGGPPRITMWFFKGLAALGHEIEYFGPRPRDLGMVPDPPVPNLTFHFYEPTRPGLMHGLALSTLPELRAAIRDADLVYNVYIWHYAQIVAARAAKRAGVPYVVAPHESLNPTALASKRWKHRAGWLGFQKRILLEAAAIHACTETEAEHARAAVPTPVIVVPFGVHVPPPYLPRKRRPGADGPIRIAFLARVVPMKGVPKLLRLLKALEAEGIDAVLDVMGSGDPSYMAELRELASRLGVEKRVEWSGWVEGDQKWNALRRADFFAISSDFEGPSMSMLEALALGAPTLRSDTARLKGVGREQGVLYVDDSEWPTDGVRAIREGLKDYEALSAAAVGHITRNFDPASNCRRLASAFEGLTR